VTPERTVKTQHAPTTTKAKHKDFKRNVRGKLDGRAIQINNSSTPESRK
jgi:hypothetical protein